MIRSVVFDVGETLLDDTREWGHWTDWLRVPCHTFSGTRSYLLGSLQVRGIDSARKAGLRTVLIRRGPWGHLWAEDPVTLAHADWVIEDWRNCRRCSRRVDGARLPGRVRSAGVQEVGRGSGRSGLRVPWGVDGWDGAVFGVDGVAVVGGCHGEMQAPGQAGGGEGSERIGGPVPDLGDLVPVRDR